MAIAALGPSGVGKIIPSNCTACCVEGSWSVATANDPGESNTDVVTALEAIDVAHSS